MRVGRAPGWAMGVMMVAFAAACAANADTSATRATVMDSAGVSILEYPGPLPRDAAFLELVWMHGHGPGDYDFQYVMQGALRSDGSVVVADLGNEEVVTIDAGGNAFDVLAVSGEGPGEVRSPGSVVTAGLDSVWVADRRNAKMMLFVRDSLVNVVSTRGDRTLTLGLRPVGASTDGRLLMITGSYRTDFEEEWLDGHMARVDLATRDVDTLGTYPMAPRQPEEGVNPFQAFGQVAGTGGGFVHGRSDIPELIWRDDDGEIAHVVRWQVDLEYPSTELWDSFEETIRADLALMNPQLGGDALQDFVDDQVAGFTVDETEPLPLYHLLSGATDGAAWLGDFVAGNNWPSGYTVVSADDTGRGHIDFGAPFLVVDVVGDLVLGVVKDDFDVQAVALYRYRFR